MGFDTRRGTRGARQPRGLVLRLANKMTMGRIRRKSGSGLLVLTTIGRKTGATRESPVRWFPAGDNAWLIVASAAGAAGNPAWYHNIAANPDQVTITVDGRTVPVTATQLNGPERDEAWKQITTASPQFAKYEDKTDRVIPVIRLTATSSS